MCKLYTQVQLHKQCIFNVKQCTLVHTIHNRNRKCAKETATLPKNQKKSTMPSIGLQANVKIPQPEAGLFWFLDTNVY